MFNNPSDANVHRFLAATGMPADAVRRGHGAVALPFINAPRALEAGSHRITRPETYEITHGDPARRLRLEASAAGDAASYGWQASQYESPFLARLAGAGRKFFPVRKYGRRVLLDRHVRPPVRMPTVVEHLRDRSVRMARLPLERSLLPLRQGRNTRDWSMVDTHFMSNVPINRTSRRMWAAPLRHRRLLTSRPGDYISQSQVTRAHPNDRMRARRLVAAAASTVARAGLKNQLLPRGVVDLIASHAYPVPFRSVYRPMRFENHPNAYVGFRGKQWPHSVRFVRASRDVLRHSAKRDRIFQARWFRLRDARLARVNRLARLYGDNAFRRRLITFNMRNIRAGGYKYKGRIGSFRSVAGGVRYLGWRYVFVACNHNMSLLQGKRKEVSTPAGAATPVAATVQETQDVDDMMSRMTIGSEFEAVLDLVNELIQRLNYLAVRIEEVDSKTLDATIDP